MGKHTSFYSTSTSKFFLSKCKFRSWSRFLLVASGLYIKGISSSATLVTINGFKKLCEKTYFDPSPTNRRKFNCNQDAVVRLLRGHF